MLIQNETRTTTIVDYGKERMDKSKELNESMSVQDGAPDEYTRKIRNMGGSE